jgi:hypothetical protein
MPTSPIRTVWTTAALVLFAVSAAHAGTGKLLLTGGVSGIDGVAGGGLTPWAVIGSNAAAGEAGLSVNATGVRVTDYALNNAGAAVGLDNRFELSVGLQDLDTGITGTGLGLPGLHLRQTILGAKVRVAGEAVLDSFKLMPQVAVGVELKSLDSSGLDGTLSALGARRTFLLPGHPTKMCH